MKRYSKLFAFALAAFFVSIVPTFAKEMTIEELETELGSEVDSFYLIGNYVFTNKNPLTTSDTMLAARSIKLSDEAQREALIKGKKAYDEMTIYYAEKTGDDTWSDLTKVLGKTELEEDAKTNVEYIDYEFVKLDAEVSGLLDTAHTDKIKQLVTGWNGNDTTLKLDGGKLTGLVKYTPDAKFSSIPEENTGYYFALEISVKDATEATTLKTITRTGTERVIPWSAWDDTSSADKKIAMLVAVSPEDTDKEFTVIVDLDGEGETYGPTEYTIDYSGVTFQTETKTEVSTELSEEAEAELNNAYGYVKNGNVTVNSSTKHQTDNLPVYKYSGTVTKQTLKDSGFTNPTAGYITFSIKPEKVIPNKTTVTIDKASNDDNSKTIIMTDDELVIIRQVKSGVTEIKITIDIDGTEDEYLPYSFYIDYSDVEVNEVISAPKELDELTAMNLKNDFNYEPKAGTKVAFAQTGNTIKATGTVMKDTTVTGFGEDTTGYYLAFSLVFDQKYEDIELTIPGRTDKIGFEAFDSDTEIGIIMQINPATRAGTSFDITVDKDGAGDVYNEEKITVDYSGVKFSSVEVEALPETSKTGFQNWMGNSYTYTDTFAFSSEKDGVITVTGEAKKHENVAKYQSYSTDYYLVYVLKFDQKYDSIKITKEGRKNPITISDFDGGSDGKLLTLVQPIKDGDGRQIKLTIDLDGDSEVYQPYNLTIDWSEVTFEKAE